MRKIRESAAFRRDYKLAKKTPRYHKNIDTLLTDVLSLLIKDHPLPSANKDHMLTGNWITYRECHINQTCCSSIKK